MYEDEEYDVAVNDFEDKVDCQLVKNVLFKHHINVNGNFIKMKSKVVTPVVEGKKEDEG
jgi:hypothetical protein